MEFVPIIISIIALSTSVGALWLSIKVYKRSQNIEKPEICNFHFGANYQFICVLNDYSSAKNLRVDKVEIKTHSTRKYANMRFEIKKNAVVNPPQMVITTMDTLNPLQRYKFKIYTNYGCMKIDIGEYFKEKS